MDIQSIFANGLPQELKNLQEGQIYIFSSPEEGASEKKIKICQYIGALAGQNKIKKEDRPAVFIIPTDNADLWEYMFCLVENPNGKFLEIAELSTITEMVYDLLGLSLKDNPPTIAGRHKKNNITISDSHPVRIPLFKSNKMSNSDGEKDEDTTYDWLTPSLSCLTNKSQSADEIRKKVLTALFDADYNKERFGVDYNIEELLKDFNAEKDKTYILEIVPEKVKKFPNGELRYFIDCHIFFTDENDNRTELILKQQEKAVYLMFLLYEEGISINEFPIDKNDERDKKKYKTLLGLYAHIQRKLLDRNEIYDPKLYQVDIRPIINKIKNKISDITPNKKYVEMFSIEGFKEEPFKIEAGTQEHRDSVIEAFKIDTQEFGL